MTDDSPHAEAAYQRLLKEYLESFDDVVITLELDAAREQGRTLEELVTATRISEANASEAVERLRRAGLIVQNTNGLGLTRSHEWVDRGIKELRGRVEANSLEVIKQLTANAIERVRTGAVRALARAFIIKRHTDG